MTTTDIIDGIIERKMSIGMTNQQLADASNVPKPTVDRVLRKETRNPSMQTILDMAAAVGYTFSNLRDTELVNPSEIGIKDPMTKHLITVYEDRCRSYEERIKRNTAHFNMLLTEKNRWIKFSLTLNIVLVVFLCLALILDLLSPGVGWIKDIQNAMYSGGGRNAVEFIRTAFGL